jgi:hypothetical protein
MHETMKKLLRQHYGALPGKEEQRLREVLLAVLPNATGGEDLDTLVNAFLEGIDPLTVTQKIKSLLTIVAQNPKWMARALFMLESKLATSEPIKEFSAKIPWTLHKRLEELAKIKGFVYDKGPTTLEREGLCVNFTARLPLSTYNKLMDLKKRAGLSSNEELLEVYTDKWVQERLDKVVELNAHKTEEDTP